LGVEGRLSDVCDVVPLTDGLRGGFGDLGLLERGVLDGREAQDASDEIEMLCDL